MKSHLKITKLQNYKISFNFPIFKFSHFQIWCLYG